MIGHTSKVLLVVGVVLCITLYWTQSRLDASAMPGPKPEVQPQFLTLGLLGSIAGDGSSATTKAAAAVRGKGGRAGAPPGKKESVLRLGQGPEAVKVQLTTAEEQALLEAVLDLEMLEDRPPPAAAEEDAPRQDKKQEEELEAEKEGPAEGAWPEGSKPKVTVLVWNQINGYVDWLRHDFLEDARTKCSTECHFTADHGKLDEAQGVLFHGPNHNPHEFPGHKPEGQKWIFMSLEQPHYFRDPGLLRDEGYRRRFDYTSTYELDSTVPITCIHPHWDAEHYHSLQPTPFDDKDGFGSPGAAVMFTSNCKNAGAEKRLRYLEELGRHMDVHSYGKCLHNKEEPPAPEGVSRAVNKQRVLSRYKFYLAFENNVIRDYVSEKAFDGLLAGSLPVYWGTSSIDRYMPGPHAVIRANDFAGPTELAQHLKTVASNRTLYDTYFDWKRAKAPAPAFRRVLESTAYKYTSMCNLCHALATRRPGRSDPSGPLMDFTAV